MGLLNFVNCVRIGFSDKGEYRVIVEYHPNILRLWMYNLRMALFCPSDQTYYGKWDENGKPVEDVKRAFDFKSMDKANLFVGYCVYPFADQNMGIFQNAAALSTSDPDSQAHLKEEKYFFNKDMKSNVEDGKNFFGFGHGRILRKQRRDMTTQLLKNVFSITK